MRAKSWLSASPSRGETPKSHVDGREIHTVDGRNPKQPLGMDKTLVNNGIFTWLICKISHESLFTGGLGYIPPWFFPLCRDSRGFHEGYVPSRDSMFHDGFHPCPTCCRREIGPTCYLHVTNLGIPFST